MTPNGDPEDRKRRIKKIIHHILRLLHLALALLVLTLWILGVVGLAGRGPSLGRVLVAIYGFPFAAFLVVLAVLSIHDAHCPNLLSTGKQSAPLLSTSGISTEEPSDPDHHHHRLALFRIFAPLLARSLLYQFAGLLYITSQAQFTYGYQYHYPWGWSWETAKVEKACWIIGVVLWSIGVALMSLDIVARAFGFTSWVWDECPVQDEGYVRLEDSDAEITQTRG